MSTLDTLLEKITGHVEHHYLLLAGETHKVIQALVKSDDKKKLYIQLLEDITHSYEIDPYHNDDHAIDRLEQVVVKIQSHLESLTETKVDESGKLYNVELSKNRVYNIYTKAGKYRGGKIYNAEKHFVLLSGMAELTTFDGEEDIKTPVVPGQIVRIGAGVPNIFYFPEDTEMLEWFDADATAEKYERYYKLKK